MQNFKTLHAFVVNKSKFCDYNFTHANLRHHTLVFMEDLKLGILALAILNIQMVSAFEIINTTVIRYLMKLRQSLGIL